MFFRRQRLFFRRRGVFFRRQRHFFRRQRRKVRLRFFKRIENRIICIYKRLFLVSQLVLYKVFEKFDRISLFSSLKQGAGDNEASEATRKN